MTFNWHDLPGREIWCVDFEYYHGPGLVNGGEEGDPITPLCCVAHEMRGGTIIELWQDELGPRPPYSLGPDALRILYNPDDPADSALILYSGAEPGFWTSLASVPIGLAFILAGRGIMRRPRRNDD